MKKIDLIDLVEFKKSVVNMLKQTGCSTFATDLKAGFTKPCFFVQINPKVEIYCDRVDESIITQINFFPASRTTEENYLIANKLRKIFAGTLICNGHVYTLNDLNIQEADNVLDMSFIVQTTSEVLTIPENKMEEINFSMNSLDLEIEQEGANEITRD